MPKKVNKININCKQCKQVFIVLPCFKQRKFCSRGCFQQYCKTGNILGNMNESWFKKGNQPYNIGKERSKEIKQKLSEALKGQSISKWHKKDCQCGVCKSKRFEVFGKNHPSYIDGQSKEPYSLEFNTRLKDKIRKRDNYTCQKCNMTEEEYIIVYGIKLCIHHIDYNKKNCDKNNLITICRECNFRANYNRDYWKKYFEEKIKINITKKK